jgi:hypothetical protein
MRRTFSLFFLSLLGLLMICLPSLAKPTHPTFGTFVNAGSVPAGSTLVLNVTYKVTNDEDSGNVGYWALANYNKQLQVWQGPDKITYYVVGRYTGNWQTFAGALSPGSGVTQIRDASGTFEGGYFGTFTFTGAFNPGDFKAKGNIGTVDFGGTKADVLLGTYGAGQTGPVDAFSVLDTYFPGYGATFSYINWGWTYHYRNQTWNNFDYGTTGDIVP